MVEQAHVRSVESIQSFRASLLVYLDRAGRALDEISEEVVRTRIWLESDRRPHWEGELRRRSRRLEEAQQQLFSARMSTIREGGQLEQMAVQRARRAVSDAETKLRSVKQWNRQFDGRVTPVAREVEKLRDVLVQHLGKAVEYLTRVADTLEDYSDQNVRGSSLSVTGLQKDSGRETQESSGEP